MSLNDRDSFRAFMAKNRNPSTAGNPEHFLPLFRQQKSLDSGPCWREYWRSSNRNLDIAALITENLKKGIPSSYCFPWHCTMIYGYVSDGRQVSHFLVGDSIGQRKYRVTPQRLASHYTVIMTLPRDHSQQVASSYIDNQKPTSHDSRIADEQLDWWNQLLSAL